MTVPSTPLFPLYVFSQPSEPELGTFLERVGRNHVGRCIIIDNLEPPCFVSWSPIAIAIVKQRGQEALRLLDSGVTPLPIENGCSLLTNAITNCPDNIELIRRIVDRRIVNINYMDSAGNYALKQASELENPDILNLLLENKADPNLSSRSGYTPLEAVVTRPYTDTTLPRIQILLKHRASIDGLCRGGWTPLQAYLRQYPASDINSSVVSCLVAAGADPEKGKLVAKQFVEVAKKVDLAIQEGVALNTARKKELAAPVLTENLKHQTGLVQLVLGYL